MTILHEIGQRIVHGRLKKDEFKIVYVAPMKALASEVTEKFSKRLSALGVICRYINVSKLLNIQLENLLEICNCQKGNWVRHRSLSRHQVPRFCHENDHC